MRLVNIVGAQSGSIGMHIEFSGRVINVERASQGLFSSDPASLFESWAEFRRWAQSMDFATLDSAPSPERADLGPVSPTPRQVFAVGLNYSGHADESGFAKPDHPVIFTKYSSSITGPYTDVALPPGSVDWEVELVVVVGRSGRNIPFDMAWEFVAGLTVGQDISEREMQHRGPAPQFGLAKSHAGFSPIGPALVTPDEFENPDDLEIGCKIDGVQMQIGRTSSLIFSVPELVARLSQTVELLPGDLIFTGTPEGVGAGRTPTRFLRSGEVLESYIEGIGHLEQRMITRSDSAVPSGV